VDQSKKIFLDQNSKNADFPHWGQLCIGLIFPYSFFVEKIQSAGSSLKPQKRVTPY